MSSGYSQERLPNVMHAQSVEHYLIAGENGLRDVVDVSERLGIEGSLTFGKKGMGDWRTLGPDHRTISLATHC